MSNQAVVVIDQPRPKGKAGRPVGSVPLVIRHIAKRFQEFGPEAVEKIVEVMRSPKSTQLEQFAAAKYILDRGYGTIPKTIIIGGSISVEMPKFEGVTPAQAMDQYARFIEGDGAELAPGLRPDREETDEELAGTEEQS